MKWNRISAYLKTPDTRSVGTFFFLNALMFGNFAVRLPDIKYKLVMDDGQLGMALLLSPLGMVIFMPIFTSLIPKHGLGKIGGIAGILLCCAVGLIGFVSSFTILCIVMFLYGAMHGGIDISSNGIVSSLEKRDKQVYMSASHGFWSMGAMAGSLMGAGIAGMNISVKYHMLISMVVGLFLFVSPIKQLWKLKDRISGSLKLVFPGKKLSVLIVIVFIMFMVEGAIGEWNAMFFHDILKAPASMVGLGFTGFTLSMAIGRMSGDAIIESFSNFKILATCLILTMAGLWLFSLGLGIWWCTIAMIISGLGCSIVVPLVFYEAGNIPNISPNLGISMTSTLGYSGLLVGPPLMGFISDKISLVASFQSLGIFLLIALLCSLIIRK